MRFLGSTAGAACLPVQTRSPRVGGDLRCVGRLGAGRRRGAPEMVRLFVRSRFALAFPVACLLSGGACGSSLKTRTPATPPAPPLADAIATVAPPVAVPVE